MCNHIEYVISQLKEYNSKLRRIAVLRYELEHPANVSLDEVIDSMSFAKNSNEGRSIGHVSNKTMHIALNYRQEAEKLNSSTLDEVMVELLKLENETERLDFYIGLLEKRQAAVLRMFYFEGRAWNDIAKAIAASPKTARNIRADALERLAEMYALTGKFRDK